MQTILVYADSLSWGIIPHTRNRLSFEHRWPGVLEASLRPTHDVRVLEDCLNGRRTAFEDPFKPGRNGLARLGPTLEMHSPLSLVIFMLGSNDFQCMHAHTAQTSAMGIASLIDATRRAALEPGMPSPAVLVVAPPPIIAPAGPIAGKFEGAAAKSVGLSEAIRAVCQQQAVDFFDAGTVTTASAVDGIHLDLGQHRTLGQALAAEVAPRLSGAKPPPPTGP